MSLEQLESKLMALPRDERRAFAEWFYKHEAEIVEEDELSDEIKAELIRRRDEIRANPSIAQPVTDEYFEQMKRRVADACAAKASAR